MKKFKKNNKGFSLVELIVVVLIMAIIAVALAPQVMKWVDNSRKSNDIQSVDSVKAAMQLAAVEGNLKTGDEITISKDHRLTVSSSAAITVDVFDSQYLPGAKDLKLTADHNDSITLRINGSNVETIGTLATVD